MADWTPGPWEAEGAVDSFYADMNIVRVDGLAVACAVQNGNITPAECAANARLIAAAPALYEALESVIREATILLRNAEGCAMEHYGDDFYEFGKPQWLIDCEARIVSARAALAQARGGV